jgi:hypothetical protein
MGSWKLAAWACQTVALAPATAAVATSAINSLRIGFLLFPIERTTRIRPARDHAAAAGRGARDDMAAGPAGVPTESP